MSDDKKLQTHIFRKSIVPPMQSDRPQTSKLGPDWRLLAKVGVNAIVRDIADKMTVGRSNASEPESAPTFDLHPFGAYENGVSRNHAIIVKHDNSLYLEDLNSTNGTRINGFGLTPKREYRLRDGDEVEFGKLKVVFQFVRTALDSSASEDTTG